MTWVLEKEVLPDSDGLLAEAVLELDGRVVAWKDDWWADGRWPKLADKHVVFRGSLANADRIVRELPWTPGSYCSTERFMCSAWWPEMSHRLVSDSFVLSTAADMVREGPPAQFGDQVFIRPDSPLKPFSGRVLGRDAITLAALDYGFYYDEMDLPIVVTPVVQTGLEWRFVVTLAGVVAGSEYTADDHSAGDIITSDHEAWRYASDVAAELRPPDPVYVMDICQTEHGLRLVELNPFSGAHLYNCDRMAVVRAVNDLAR